VLEQKTPLVFFHTFPEASYSRNSRPSVTNSGSVSKEALSVPVFHATCMNGIEEKLGIR
jgi:hypothetical protein